MHSPILCPRGPTSVYPKFQKQLMDFRVLFETDTLSAFAFDRVHSAT